MKNKAFIQVGVTATRTPSGAYLPSVPLYIEVDHLCKSGLTPAHENAIRDIAGFFVEKLNEENEKQQAT